MEPSCRWGARYDFAAFDIGVPGSCALHVHYSVRPTNSLDAQPEQCRISLQARGLMGCDGVNVDDYAFPPHIVNRMDDAEKGA